MSQMSLVQAVASGLANAMEEDDRVVVLGEDVGRLGGVFRATQGLESRYGEERVIDTPLSECGIVGAAIGIAMMGDRPVVEIQFADFIWPAVDQLVNEAAKMRYRTGGEWTVPMVVRVPFGGGIRGGHYHSQSPESVFVHTAGLKVVCPSNPYDAKGLLLASIDDPDPVIFLEPKRVYRAVKMDVPDDGYRIALGEAQIVREGTHVTCVTYGAMLYEALAAADEVAKQGIEVEVVDLRTLSPLDEATIIASVEKTGRFCVVHEAPLSCGLGAELVAIVNEKAFLRLEAPPARVAGFDTPFPYAHENEYLPLAHRIAPALRSLAKY